MNFKVEFRFGLIISFLFLFWYTMEYVLGVHSTKQQYHVMSSVLFNIPMGALMIYSIWIKKKIYNNNEITFMDALKHGLAVSFYAGSFSMITFFVFVEFINPNFFTSMIDFQAARYMESGILEEEARRFASSSFNMRSYLFNTFLSMMGFGCFFSLIGAFVLKNKEADQ